MLNAVMLHFWWCNPIKWQTMTLWSNPMKPWTNDVMVKAEEAKNEWCHGKALKNSQKWCHRKAWSNEQLILWCNVLWGANKWLIRVFPNDLSIKGPILATQISSLFASELRTPSLVYVIICGSAFEVKQNGASITWKALSFPDGTTLPKLCLVASLKLERMVVSATITPLVSVAVLVAWVFRLKIMSLTYF